MKKEEIEKSKAGKLIDFNGHRNLLVSFGGINQRLGMPVFEFFNSLSDTPCDKIFFRDFNQAWYQKGVDEELDHVDKVIEYLRKRIRHNRYERVCFIGNSMGGYAAILFGSILDIDTVIFFAPQTYINRFNRYINFDRRWASQLSKVHKFKNKRKKYFDLGKHLSTIEPYKTEINIYYSPNHSLDRKHSERLKSKKNIKLFPIHEGGHSVVKVVRDSGELKLSIQSTFEL